MGKKAEKEKEKDEQKLRIAIVSSDRCKPKKRLGNSFEALFFMVSQVFSSIFHGFSSMFIDSPWISRWTSMVPPPFPRPLAQVQAGVQDALPRGAYGQVMRGGGPRLEDLLDLGEPLHRLLGLLRP